MIKAQVQHGKILQVMSMNRNGEWDWFTIDADLQDSVLQECIDERLPFRMIDKPIVTTESEPMPSQSESLETDITIISPLVSLFSVEQALYEYWCDLEDEQPNYHDLLNAIKTNTNQWQQTNSRQQVVEIVDKSVKDYYNSLHSWEDANPLKLIDFIKKQLKNG